MSNLLTCAKAPCKTCPYRRDVPSGVWAAEEYVKLPKYDGDIIDQLRNCAVARFDCHQQDGNLCAGWVAAHGAHNLLALRLQADKIDPAVWRYTSPVPLFPSGKEACDHGLERVDHPDLPARRAISVLLRKEARRKLGGKS